LPKPIFCALHPRSSAFICFHLRLKNQKLKTKAKETLRDTANIMSASFSRVKINRFLNTDKRFLKQILALAFP
jgi:hypothetical protein